MIPNRLKKCSLVFLPVFFATTFLVSARLWAASPTESVKNTVDQVLKILHNPNLKGDARKTERRKQLRQVILRRFDMPEIAKRSLGAHWRQNREKQQEFVSAFTGFLQESYVGSIESYADEKILFNRERMDKEIAQVETRIVRSKRNDVLMNYRLHRVGKEWKVYDVLVENVSLVNNFRSQFDRILATESVDSLIKRLQAKKL